MSWTSCWRLPQQGRLGILARVVHQRLVHSAGFERRSTADVSGRSRTVRYKLQLTAAFRSLKSASICASWRLSMLAMFDDLGTWTRFCRFKARRCSCMMMECLGIAVHDGSEMSAPRRLLRRWKVGSVGRFACLVAVSWSADEAKKWNSRKKIFLVLAGHTTQ